MFKYLSSLLFFVPNLAFAHSEDDSFMHGTYSMMGFGCAEMSWLWWFIIFIFLIILVAVIATIVLATKGSSKEEDLLSIAKERFAKGEITKKELEEIKKELRKKD